MLLGSTTATSVGAVDGTEPVSTVAGGNGYGSADNQLNGATKVDVGSDGSLYIADTNNHRVQKVATDGTISTVAGGNGPGSANNQLSGPFGITFGNDGSLYIADTYNHRVQKVTTDGTVTTVAGGNGPGSANLNAESQRLANR